MWLILFAGICAGLALLSWVVISGRTPVRLLAVLAALVIAYCIGYGIGGAWEMMRYHDRFVYPFSLYSAHLRELVAHHQIDRLTNDIVAFDSSFNPHKNPDDLWSAVTRMLNDSPSGTNKNEHAPTNK